MGYPSALGRDEFRRVGQKAARIGAAPARVTGREMAADITGADRAEDRIGQRVQPDIGVGMAEQGPVMSDFDAVDPDMIARNQLVDVETLNWKPLLRLAAEIVVGLLRWRTQLGAIPLPPQPLQEIRQVTISSAEPTRQMV